MEIWRLDMHKAREERCLLFSILLSMNTHNQPCDVAFFQFFIQFIEIWRYFDESVFKLYNNRMCVCVLVGWLVECICVNGSIRARHLWNQRNYVDRIWVTRLKRKQNIKWNSYQFGYICESHKQCIIVVVKVKIERRWNIHPNLTVKNYKFLLLHPGVCVCDCFRKIFSALSFHFVIADYPSK